MPTAMQLSAVAFLTFAPFTASAQLATDLACVGCVSSTDLATGSVTTGRIALGAVTSNRILDGSVTASKIATGAVKTGEIALGAVTNNRIANGAVTVSKIATGAVTTGRLALGAVTNNRIADGAVRAPKISDGSIQTSKIVDGAVTSAKIAPSAISTTEIANGAVTAAKLDMTGTVFIEDSGDNFNNCTKLISELAVAVDPTVIVRGPGVYDCGATQVTIPTGVSLIGSGRRRTIIRGSTNFAVLKTSGDNIEIADLFLNRHSTNVAEARGIEVGFPSSSDQVIIRNVRISATNGTTASYGIFAGNCSGLRVENVQIDATTGNTGANAFGIYTACGGTKNVFTSVDILALTSDTTGAFCRGVQALTVQTQDVHRITDSSIQTFPTTPANATVNSVLQATGKVFLVLTDISHVVSGTVTEVANY